MVAKNNNQSEVRHVAAIDIGSNSIHMIIVEVCRGQRFYIIDREKEMVRLGSGSLQTHHLSQLQIDQTVNLLKRFLELANADKAYPVLVTATSAVREAWNREDFVSQVEEKTGLHVEILPGVEEARLISLAVNEVIDFNKQRGLIVDIGGGSTEFISLFNHKTELLLSVKLGAVRLYEQFLSQSKSDVCSSKDIQALANHIRSGLARTIREIKQVGDLALAIGTSGTILSLACTALKIPRESGEGSTFSLTLPLEQLQNLNKQLQKSTLKERRRLPGLDSRRADIIIPGGILLEVILNELEINEISTCDWALREGIILNYFNNHEPELLDSNSYNKETNIQNPDSARTRSILSLARRYDYEVAHSHHTAELACKLFDETQSIHGLDKLEREWLEYAAILHDIGYHIAHNGHHKHGMYLIRNAELPGFSFDEIMVISNIVRYHRGSLPKSKHSEFIALSPTQRDVVCKLASILKIADSLDRRHLNVINDLNIKKISDNNSVLNITAKENCDIEVWCTARHLSMFESIFHTSLTIEVV